MEIWKNVANMSESSMRDLALIVNYRLVNFLQSHTKLTYTLLFLLTLSLFYGIWIMRVCRVKDSNSREHGALTLGVIAAAVVGVCVFIAGQNLRDFTAAELDGAKPPQTPQGVSSDKNDAAARQMLDYINRSK